VNHDELHLDGPGDDDPTGALLREVLHRQADAVRPGSDGLARIQAEIARQQPRLAPAGRARWSAPRAGHWRRGVPLLAAAAALVVVAAGGTAAVRGLSHRQEATAAGQGDVILRYAAQSDVQDTPASSLPVYVTARQRGRVVLFREFRSVKGLDGVNAKVGEAVRLALTQRPQDADYVQLFAAAPAPRVQAVVTASTITLDISPAPLAGASAVTPEEAKAAADQIVWTATAAAATATQAAGASAQPAPAGGRGVHITLGGREGQSLFGLVPLSPDLKRETGAQDPRAGVWIIDVAEGSRRRAGPLDAAGEAVAMDGEQVLVVLRRDGRIVRSEFVPLTASEASGGSQPPRPGQRGSWHITAWDTTSPGTYTLEVFSPPRLPAATPQALSSPAAGPAATGDPAAAGPAAPVGGAVDGDEPWSDSKMFLVR
jgi:hypothetical protein